MTDHLITPPPELVLIRPPHELVQQWVSLAGELEGFDPWQELATQAARWGADQELEACCEWLEDHDCDDPQEAAKHLRTARRPKPPSLKEQALEALYRFDDGSEYWGQPPQKIADDFLLVRRALESLPD